jgi:hypothetical protein
VVVEFVDSFDGVEGPVRKNAIRVISKTKLRLFFKLKNKKLKKLKVVFFAF